MKLNKTLLILGFVWPEPKSSAAGVRMLQLINFFKSLNYTITFASPCSKSDHAFDLKTLNIEQIAIELNSTSFDFFIKQLNPDIVLFDRFMMEEQFGWRVAEQCPHALRILDTEDLHGLRKARQLALKDGKPCDETYLFNDTAKREIASIYRSDLSLIISDFEMNILKQQFKVDENLLLYIPFMLDEISEKSIESLPEFEEREHFITIGNFLHDPNLDSILYLKETIWPLIRKTLPKSELHIYGAYASNKASQLHNEKEGFLIKGFTDDVNEVMQKARICLAPLRFGAGLKGKLIDAMLNGTPCVTTSIGAEGIFGNLESNGFIKDTPKAFANRAVQLYTDKSSWKKIQLHGFQVLHERFNKKEIDQKLKSVLLAYEDQLRKKRQANFMGQILWHHTLLSTKYMSKWIEEKNRKIDKI